MSTDEQIIVPELEHIIEEKVKAGDLIKEKEYDGAKALLNKV